MCSYIFPAITPVSLATEIDVCDTTIKNIGPERYYGAKEQHCRGTCVKKKTVYIATRFGVKNCLRTINITSACV